MRILIFVPFAVYLRYRPGFSIDMGWYVSILSVTAQAIVSFLLVRREFILKPVTADDEPPKEVEPAL